MILLKTEKILQVDNNEMRKTYPQASVTLKMLALKLTVAAVCYMSAGVILQNINMHHEIIMKAIVSAIIYMHVVKAVIKISEFEKTLDRDHDGH